MLVTIIVVTYNSAKYIIETLDSVSRQTYHEIELIISDDCSKDNTFSLCKAWIESHKNRFKNAAAIQTPQNSGICHNYNYALYHASGEYIKYIAGDDILEDNCIEQFVRNIQPDTFLYTCILAHLHNETGEKEYYKTRIPNTSAKKQARFMLKCLYGINGPTIFINKKKLLELGGFDEQFSYVEDLPIALKFATNGYRIGIIDQKLVQWRIYGTSISHSNHAFAVSLRDATYYYARTNCIKYFLPFHLYHYWLNQWIIRRKENGESNIWGYLLRTFDFVNMKRKMLPIPDNPYQKI